MAYELKDDSGSLFRNNKKEKDTHPDYTGQAMIHGAQYWVSAWLKTSQDGKKFFSMAYKPKIEPVQRSISERAMPRRSDPISTGRPAPMQRQNIMPDDDDRDIPF